jgi:hypothetical protein
MTDNHALECRRRERRAAAQGGRYAVKKEYIKGVINHESQGSDSNTRIRRLVEVDPENGAVA